MADDGKYEPGIKKAKTFEKSPTNATDLLIAKSYELKEYETKFMKLKKQLEKEIRENKEASKNVLIFREKKRHPYSRTESLIMIYYLIFTNTVREGKKGVNGAKGLEIWKKFENQNHLPGKTASSLWDQFISNILPGIEEYGLPKKIESQFQSLRLKQKKTKEKSSEKCDTKQLKLSFQSK